MPAPFSYASSTPKPTLPGAATTTVPTAPVASNAPVPFKYVPGATPAAPAAANLPVAPAPNAIVQTGKTYGGMIVGAKDKIISSVSEAADKVAERNQKAPTLGNELGKAGDLAEGGLGAAAGFTQAVFAPIAAPIQTLLDHTAKANAARAANNQADPAYHGDTPEAVAARKQISDFVAAHPHASKVIGDLFTVGSALGGGESEIGAGLLRKPVSEAVDEIATTAAKIPPVAAKLPGAIKTAAADTKNAIKAPFMPTVEAAAAKESKGVIDAIRDTEDNMTPTMKKEAIDSGRQTVATTRLGGTKVDYTPTKETVRAAEILQDKRVLNNPVTSKDLPHTVLAKTKAAIARLGGDAEKYLEAHPTKVTNNEDYTLFQGLRKEAERISTPEELKAYDQQITLFQKQLFGRPGGYTTANYYKALKDWESNIADKLPRGKEALLDPTGVANAKIRAASDIRSAVRKLISSKHPEYASKMYDLRALYEAKDNAIQNASKVKSQTLLQKYPIIRTGVKAAGLGAGLHILP